MNILINIVSITLFLNSTECSSQCFTSCFSWCCLSPPNDSGTDNNGTQNLIMQDKGNVEENTQNNRNNYENPVPGPSSRYP